MGSTWHRWGALPSHTRTPRASTLIIAFSGGAINKIGIPWHEFRRTLSSSASASECDQLYVLDPTGMSMYAHGLAQFEQMLRDLTAGYARCVFVGNCMVLLGRCDSHTYCLVPPRR